MELIVLARGQEHRVEIERLDGAFDRGFEVRLGDARFHVDTTGADGSLRSLVIDGRQFEVAVHAQGEGRYEIGRHGSSEEVEVLDPLAYLAREASGKEASRGLQRVTAYMPGRVVKVEVAEGDEIKAGQGLIVLEAMKMENEIVAERDGVVRKVLVEEGQPVEGGDVMFEIE